MVGREGLEPSRDGLKARCSATELPARDVAATGYLLAPIGTSKPDDSNFDSNQLQIKL